jgi:hypothetical protein
MLQQRVPIEPHAGEPQLLDVIDAIDGMGVQRRIA